MRIHDLKTDPDHFIEIYERMKTAELRLDDRGFRVNDFLLLKEYDRKSKFYSSKWIIVQITHILTPEYSTSGGLKPSHVMMSFRYVMDYTTKPERPIS